MMGDRVVDINVATVEELETLVGVGRAKAEAIVATRSVSVKVYFGMWGSWGVFFVVSFFSVLQA